MSQTITINRELVKSQFENRVYKYANAVDSGQNPKAVRNIKSDVVDDTTDAIVVDTAFDRRLKEVLGIMRDFGAAASTSGDNVSISFDITSRWAGTTTTLQTLVSGYILDGIMADWCNVVAPTEAAVYTAKMTQGIIDIKQELYTKKAPQ